LLARENKKFRYVDVRKGGRASQFESAIEWLRKSGLVHPVVNITTSKLRLSGYSDNRKFKLYIMESGLLGAMLDVASSTIVTGDKLFSEYCGAFVENYVVTELVKCGFEDLYYWTSGGEAEVDLILAHRDRIYPLEIKSGMSRRTKSIRVYAMKHNPSHLFRTSPRNCTRDGDMTNIPLYAIARFSDVVDRTCR
ncbi:MAG: DUF4143 domain-containing protein, partial [Candidatus Eisenbacteria sp.]|nr:DUF4143 domain-containing protein [Candidatus Eisenbacteria bacterium]